MRVLLLLACLCFTALQARPVRVTLWISGGLDGVLTAGRAAPGLLGVAQGFSESGADFWLDVGGSTDFTDLEAPWLPDVFVPNAAFLRQRGVAGLSEASVPWSLLNVDLLPQYPEYPVPSVGVQGLRHPDGPEISVWGMLTPNAGLRVPPARLRPWRVTDAAASLRDHLPEVRAASGVHVLVLPEDVPIAEWSRQFPDFPVLVEPAGATASVIPLDDGKRIRVRPAVHGRAVVRVTVVWDSVSKSYGNPVGEVVWVRTPDLSGVALPEVLAARLRPLHPVPDADALRGEDAFRKALANALLAEGDADVVLLPRWQRRDLLLADRPEGWRVAWVPENDGWLRVEVSSELARTWMGDAGAAGDWFGELRRSSDPRVLLPAHTAAGGGGDTRHVRAGVDAFADTGVWMPFTTRDFLPLPKAGGAE